MKARTSLGQYDSVMGKKVSINLHDLSTALAALMRYERRQARTEYPAGGFDKAKRWYPAGRDEEVMDAGRSPTRSYPNSFNLACRSLAHCERYEGADHEVVLKLKRELKKAGIQATSKESESTLRAALLDEALPRTDSITSRPRF